MCQVPSKSHEDSRPWSQYALHTCRLWTRLFQTLFVSPTLIDEMAKVLAVIFRCLVNGVVKAFPIAQIERGNQA